MHNSKLFQFSITKHDATSINAQIIFNANNQIYKGHFPQAPITPGVCQVHIIKTVLCKALNKDYNLIEAKEIKFLSMHNPAENNIMKLNLNYNSINEHTLTVIGVLTYNNTTYMKFNGKFQASH